MQSVVSFSALSNALTLIGVVSLWRVTWRVLDWLLPMGSGDRHGETATPLRSFSEGIAGVILGLLLLHFTQALPREW